TWTFSTANSGTLNGTSFTAMESFGGGTGTDTLIGPNLTNTWNITTPNGGTPRTVPVSGQEKLVRGTRDHTFKFSNGVGVWGTINGGTGTNLLDYSLYITGVTVDLTAGTATGTAGISNIQNITGTPANDTLIGDGNANVITAAGGSDVL